MWGLLQAWDRMEPPRLPGILIDWLRKATHEGLHKPVSAPDRGVCGLHLRRRLVPRAQAPAAGHRLHGHSHPLALVDSREQGDFCLGTVRIPVATHKLNAGGTWAFADIYNTYKYEDLVRMMDEIVSALEGKIRVPTVVDYKEVLLALVPVELRTQHLCSFLCELSLLHTSLSAYAPARLAAAALLLARLTHRQTQPWTTQLWDLTGFSYEDLIPCVLSLHKKCFHDDAPKDYRQVSLTAVKQRFEDKRYGEISQEKVLSYSQLCAALGMTQDSPDPPTFLSTGEIHAFLSSPSGRRTKRKWENSLQEDRGSFVTTPTAELSSQEETLLGSFLDWSLDCCSGYEGDQESEGEKEGDVTAPSGILDVTVVYLNPEQHCCQESSDEEACPEDERPQDPQVPALDTQIPATLGPKSLLRTSPEPGKDVTTSGYSSVSTTSPTSSVDGGLGVLPRPTSVLSLDSDSHTQPCHHQARKSCLQCRPPSPPESSVPRQQVKRINLCIHSEEDTNLGLVRL
nr:cyclin-F-like [Chlorocebus sabaeus]